MQWYLDHESNWKEYEFQVRAKHEASIQAKAIHNQVATHGWYAFQVHEIGLASDLEKISYDNIITSITYT